MGGGLFGQFNSFWEGAFMSMGQTVSNGEEMEDLKQVGERVGGGQAACRCPSVHVHGSRGMRAWHAVPPRQLGPLAVVQRAAAHRACKSFQGLASKPCSRERRAGSAAVDQARQPASGICPSAPRPLAPGPAGLAWPSTLHTTTAPDSHPRRSAGASAAPSRGGTGSSGSA